MRLKEVKKMFEKELEEEEKMMMRGLCFLSAFFKEKRSIFDCIW